MYVWYASSTFGMVVHLRMWYASSTVACHVWFGISQGACQTCMRQVTPKYIHMFPFHSAKQNVEWICEYTHMWHTSWLIHLSHDSFISFMNLPSILKSYAWMSHRMNELCMNESSHEWVMWHINESRGMSHVHRFTYSLCIQLTPESHEWVMWHLDKSCPTVMLHNW